jgi:carboxypeptidase C (cathepsin A)
LLDASDLVFIDAPGTGFSRIITKKEGGVGTYKDFFGIDEDANAFAQFIGQFLSKYQRWNSPKYLFGESYGTTRSAVLANDLETHANIDLNGVILLSEVLSFDVINVDGPERNPGDPLPYALALPTYAATAWYHHKLPAGAKKLKPLLKKVEHFAMTKYMHALQAGSTLSKRKRNQIAKQLHKFTGLSVAYLNKADLRVNGGEFEKNLLGDTASTGRLDTRFSGPNMDPLSQSTRYDPQSAAISSAYVSLFNNYVRQDLHFGKGMHYRPNFYSHTGPHWNFKHKAPGSHYPQRIPNVMPDLAHAMKYNPKLRVMLNAGYYDLATPFYAAVYTMHHLPIEKRLQHNIEYAYYRSGHMVYVHKAALKKLHDNVAKFIETPPGNHGSQ